MLEKYKRVVLIAELMRTAQKEYFTDRTTEKLNRSKSLERSLDNAITELRAEEQNPNNNEKQLELL